MIYALQSGDHLKIGYSQQPVGRLARCKTWRPDARLVFEMETLNDRESERALHEYFRESSVDGEWFAINLRSIVQALLDLNLVGQGQAVLELKKEPLPPIHPQFYNFLCRYTGRTEFMQYEAEDLWETHHATFLAEIETKSPEQIADDLNAHHDESFARLRNMLKG